MYTISKFFILKKEIPKTYQPKVMSSFTGFLYFVPNVLSEKTDLWSYSAQFPPSFNF